jgi:imidazolonepropionase-like amidohydrolase
VRLSAAPDALKLTLILRGGRISAIQDASKDPPPDARVIDGMGLIALPAFIDAYAYAGTSTPTPNAERDVAPKPAADVLVDMREANRKGIEPGFRAVDSFDLDAETGKRYRGSGFGSLLSSPHGQLLSGASVFVSTRDAAARDVVIVPIEFDHAGFEATGPGYPSTLMGSVAQLRQFFLDAFRQRELERRRSSGKPTTRSPYDSDLAAILPALAKQRRIVCEAQTADDIERWIKLADELGVEIAISGGREAWKRAALLSARKIPVFLTLDWGEEVEDPHAKVAKGEAEKKIDAPKPDTGQPGSDKPEAASRPGEPLATKPVADKAAREPGAETSPKTAADSTAKPAEVAIGNKTAARDAAAEDLDWTYEQPLRVREELRRQWEEVRDCAVRLSEANVTFAFGSGKLAPKEILDRVRTLVQKGLSVDVAQRALTSDAAMLLGVPNNLGKLEVGFDATVALWTKNPLAAKDAKLAWLFVDGFPYEFDLNANDLQGKPDEGVDATGTWTFEFDTPEAKPAIAELKMSKDGGVKGTIRYRNPADDKESSGEFEGRVAGKKLKLSGRVRIGSFEAMVEIEGEIQGDTMTGSTAWKFSGSEDSRHYKATRKPNQAEDEQ